MNKVSLTIWYNQANSAHNNFQTIQEIDMSAVECSKNLVKLDTTVFAFGKAVIYTEGVRAFLFEDVKDDE